MKDKHSKLGHRLRQEKGLLVLCLVLAFFAWQGIRKNIGFEVSVSNIAVDIDLPEGWAVLEKSTHQVNIVFRGSREDIRYLNNEQLRVVIPMTDPEHGKEIAIKLSKAHLRNPTRAGVVRFSPSEIVVKLDQESERLLPIKAAVKGSLPEGLEIDRIVCTPASIRVSGARQVLDHMENIHTEPIELKDRQASFKARIPVSLPQVGRMQVDPDWVSVEFFLEERNGTESFSKIPVRILSAPGEQRRIEVSPKTITLTVHGPKQRIEQMQSANVFAYVSCHDLAENTTYDLPVMVDLPSGLQLVKTDPAVVHIEIDNAN